MHDSVTVHMNAPADKIWDLLSDVTRIGRYSPETFEAVWLDGATGPATGARFKGHVKRNEKGPIYWTTCTVRECVPGQEFTFGVGNSKSPLNIWGYTLEPNGDGTDVTESFQLADKPVFHIYWALLGRFRGRRNHDDMLRTLERVKADVENS